jgi:two-component system chemotaxis response regulator CheB
MSEMKKIRLLIVEDSAFMRIAIERMLKEDARIEVIGSASNGQEAVEKVARLKPDVVTMDIEMPIMDGLHALKEVMQHSPVPVIMVSSLTQKGAQVTLDALDLGATDYIGKPGSNLSVNIFTLKAELLAKVAAAAESKPTVHKTRLPSMQPKRMTTPDDAISQVDRVVVIGSSTGGPPAIRTVLSGLPANLAAPVIIAQHMPQMFTNAFAQRLNSLCNLRVKEAVDGEVIQRSVVYVCPGDHQTRVRKNEPDRYVFSIVSNDSEKRKFAPCIDQTFLSVVEHFGRKTLGVILTGMGDNGAKAMSEIRNVGGMTIAQDKGTSVVYGMPRAVAECGAAARILPIQQIAAEIELALR